MLATDRQLLDRFNCHQEESAFEALLERHGPMVHGLCRRLLNDHHAAGDAFQATFLVLARRAASIRRPDSLSSWLYGVAYRIAGKLRMRRDRSRETSFAEPPEVFQSGGDPLTTAIWSELRGVLDEELSQLPEKYRAPLVLCHLEGKSKAEAARELGWPLTSMVSRLERGQDLLRGRLAGRGVALSAALIFPALAHHARAVPPAALTQLTARAAALLTLGEEATIGGVSAPVAALVDGMVRAMFVAKLTVAAAILLAIGMLSVGGLLVQQVVVAQAPPAAEPTPPAPAPNRDQAKPLALDCFADPLPPDAQARLGTVRLRHVGVTFVGMIRDGKEIVTGDSSGTFRVWDVASGRELRRFGKTRLVFANRTMQILSALGGSSTGATLLADGRTLVETTTGGAFRFWDTATSKELRQFKPAEAAGFGGFAVAADGKTVFTLGRDFVVRQWDVATSKEVRRFGQKLEGERSFIGGNPLALSLDGKNLAAALPGTRDKKTAAKLCLWDVADGRESATIESPNEYMDAPLFTPDGKRLIWLGLLDTDLQLYETATGKKLKSVGPFEQGKRRSLAFSPDGRLLAMLDNSGSVDLWDVETGKQLRSLAAANGQNSSRTFFAVDYSQSLAFSSNGKILTASGASNTIRRWEVETGKEVSVTGGHVGSITAVAISTDGKEVVSCGADRTLRRWDSASGKESGRIPLPGWAVHAAFSADGRLAALGDGLNRVELWDVAAGKMNRKLAAPVAQDTFSGNRNDLAFSPDGKILAVRTADQTISLWDTATGKPLHTIPHDGKGGRFLFAAFGQSGGPTTPRLAFAPDGELLAAVMPVGGREEMNNNGVTIHSAPDSVIRLWHVPTGKPVRSFTKHSGILLAIAFSLDGRTVAGIDADQVVLWETATGKERCRFQSGGQAVAFLADGRTLAAGSGDGTVRLWDVSTGQEIGQFKGHQGAVTALASSPDGKALISVGADTTALIWNLARRARLKAGPAPALDAKTQETLWNTLAGTDAGAAFKAIRALGAAPEAAVAVGKRLRPTEPAPADRLKQLLTGLQSNQFAIREKAAEELDKLGDLAEPALRETLAGQPSLEVRQRVEKLLERLVLAPLSPEQLRGVRVVEMLEQAATPEARQLLQELAQGAPSARQTREAKAALRRLGA